MELVSRGGGATSRAAVLDEDPGLYEVVPEGRVTLARRASTAAVHSLPSGSWSAAEHADLARGGYGLLVLDGVLIRRVGLDGRFGAELLAQGDLLRPWQHDGERDVMPFETAWRVVAPARLAVLDLDWATRVAPFPQIGAELAGRALERSLRLATLMAIVQQPKLEQRLWMLFWELAQRHGKVHVDGVHVELPLTHEVISHLAAARRPSVSAALTKLAARGAIRREGRGWVIAGEPPATA
jgi:CRP/FNR family cyclic AMP-dependent transcriptional regulator